MSRMVKAGKFNKVITIQKYDSKKKPKDEEGNRIWDDLATVRASIEPLQGREYFSGPFQMGENITRFRIHYIPNITRKMRIKYKDKYFDIYSVIDSKETHRELQIMCKEGEAYGVY